MISFLLAEDGDDGFASEFLDARQERILDDLGMSVREE